MTEQHEILYRAHQQILRILQKRGFFIPDVILNRTIEQEKGFNPQDIYSNSYFRLTSNNLIEYVYIGFKLISENKTKVSTDDIKAFISMVNAPLINERKSDFIDGYSLPIFLNYNPSQISKTFDDNYFYYSHQFPIIAPCPRQVILITNDAPNIKFKEFANTNSLENGGIDLIQHFLVEELLFDVMEHISQAQYFPLSKIEKKQILEEIEEKEGQFPILLESDPVAKYLGLKKGVLVRILQNLDNLPSISTIDIEYRIVS